MSVPTATPVLDESVPDSLKSFVGANTMLLAAMGAMTGLATFVGRGTGPDWSASLLQFLLTGLAFLLWLELLTQWPPALLLHRAPAPAGIPWRLVWFAYGMQLAMVGLIANAVWRQPQLLAPTLGLGVGVVLWRALPAHVRSRPAALVGVGVAVVLASVVVVVVVDPPVQTGLERLWAVWRSP
jgi:hypothetical protein